MNIATMVPRCTLAADGIWYAPDQDIISYSSAGNDACFEFEDASFWFRHRNACIEAAVREFQPPPGHPIFDIGGGNGFVSLGLLQAGFDVIVVEPGRNGATNSKKRGLPAVVCATSSSAGIPRSSLGAVGLFDVIEHIDDDVTYLRSLRTLLKDGGRLYATVPAHNLLWSEEDEIAGHYRRYTLRSVCSAVERSGFGVDYATYIFRPLLLPILVLRATPYRLRKRRKKSQAPHGQRDHVPRQTLATKALLAMLPSEVRAITSRKTISMGASCLIVATAR